MSFVHLHVHSHYSLLDGLPKIKDLVAKAKEYEMPAMALTDHGTMYGAIEFYTKCRAEGIKPIIGMESYIAPRRLIYKKPKIDEKPFHLLLLAKNLTGYKNLIQLSTISHLDGFYYKPRIDKDVLRQHSEGLIASSACLGGEVSRLLNHGQHEQAKQVALEYQNVFGKDNFYLELEHIPRLEETAKVNDLLIELSQETGIPLIVTTDAHYINEDDAEAQDVLVCINTGKTLDQDDRMKMSDFIVSLTDPKILQEKFKHVPQALENTVKIAEMCNLELDLKTWNFPEFDVPEGKTADELLIEKTYEGYQKKEGEMTPEIKERLEYELDIITYKKYSSYFLIVADLMVWARAQGIIATTRGSASGSLVSYSLDITTVNPLKFQLPFERFLTKQRPSPPDIDCDIQDNRRDEVIEYVKQRYGEDRVAQVCTFGTMAARAAARDVTRVLGLPYAFGDKLAKMIPIGSQGFPMTIEKAKETSLELNSFYKSDSQAKRVLDLAEKIEGCARHVSVHAAATIIAPSKLTNFIPLQRDPKGRAIITQYDMYVLDPNSGKETVGLLKMDFLGLRNLSILGIAIEIIKHTKGEEIDIQKIHWDDKKAFELISKGRTLGVFQLSSSGMTRYLMELKPTNIFDIMAMVALYRPGPMEIIPEYIKRKRNPSTVTYPHPKLQKILERTFGLLIYQDDVMQTAMILGGYDPEEADMFRKAMGKKIPELMAEQKIKFIQGCIEHSGLPENKAKEIWGYIEPFAGYGFNKSHSASYAVVAYQTAYLKANYTSEFMSAMMTAEARNNNTDKVAEAVKECEVLGIKVLPPDVNQSLSDFTYISDTEIRFGLKAIKNLGSDIIRSIIKERKANGGYKTLEDFLSRVKTKNLNKKSVEAMVKSGAMDCFGDRSQLFGNTDRMLDYVRKINKEAENGQTSLFGALPENSDNKNGESLRLVGTTEVDLKTKLSWEKELLGLYVSNHPFASLEGRLEDTIIPCSKLRDIQDSTYTNVGGVINKIQKIFTKKQELMIFATLEDTSASVELLVFPKVLKTNPELWAEDKTVVVRGRVSDKDGVPKILVDKGFEVGNDNIDEVKKNINKGGRSGNGYRRNGFGNGYQNGYNNGFNGYGGQMSNGNGNGSNGNGNSKTEQERNIINAGQIWISLPRRFNTQIHTQLKEVFVCNPGGCKVFLTIQQAGNLRRIETSWEVCWHEHIQMRVEQITGPGSVEVKAGV